MAAGSSSLCLRRSVLVSAVPAEGKDSSGLLTEGTLQTESKKVKEDTE